MKKELQVLHFMHLIGKLGLGLKICDQWFCSDKSVVRMAKSKVLGLVEKTTPDLMLRKKCCEKSIFGQFDF